jgi:hypothetical protein
MKLLSDVSLVFRMIWDINPCSSIPHAARVGRQETLLAA